LTVCISTSAVTFNRHIINLASSPIIVYINPVYKSVLNWTQVCQLLCKNPIARNYVCSGNHEAYRSTTNRLACGFSRELQKIS